MVTLTGKATEEFKKFLNGEKPCGIRIFASTACCGPPLSMGVAKGPEQGDVTD